jgi:hypothetical protein
MSYKTTKSILGLAALLLATASCTDAQSRFRGREASTLPPPVANSEAEKRILATID